MIDFDEIMEAAREAMDLGETTKAGLPKVEAMEAILGYEITAEDRDAAYEALQGLTEAAESDETVSNIDKAAGEVDTVPQKFNEALVYVGPNLTGSNHVLQFTVFRGGLPEGLRARVETDTKLARLFVPVDQLTAARKQLSAKGSLLNNSFREVAGRRNQ